MRHVKTLIVVLLAIASSAALSDWHGGKLAQVSVGYDGKTIALRLEGWNRTNCTCYPTWPNHMCLDSTRTTHDFEKSILLMAAARNTEINVHIEEASCKIVAVYEVRQ